MKKTIEHLKVTVLISSHTARATNLLKFHHQGYCSLETCYYPHWFGCCFHFLLLLFHPLWRVVLCLFDKTVPFLTQNSLLQYNRKPIRRYWIFSIASTIQWTAKQNTCFWHPGLAKAAINTIKQESKFFMMHRNSASKTWTKCNPCNQTLTNNENP